MQPQSLDFLTGGGVMGEHIRSYDWVGTPLGSPENWPQSLRLTIRIILNTRHPMFIWWGPEFIQFYNDAYSETMGPERHPSALGQHGQECWSEIWPIIGPQIDFVMKGNGSTWDEDRLVPVTRHGRLENVWWTYSFSPIDIEGEVGGVLVVCNDVTRQHIANDMLRGETERMALLLEQAPGFMAVLRGPEHKFELANASYRQMTGDRDLVGLTVREAFPEIFGQGFFELLDAVYLSGQAHVGRRVPISFHNQKDLYLDFVYQPIVDSQGSITGIFVEGADVTDHVRAEEHLRLINLELKHRVKNTLAVVSAIAAQTLNGTGRDDALRSFAERLAVFGKAHDILTATTGSTAEIYDVVSTALAAHASFQERLSILGPPVTIGSKQALSLALAIHELATNAIKYGALSNISGIVDITWMIKNGESEDNLVLRWEEKFGPAVLQPERQGFGSKLIVRVLKADFNGDISVSYLPDGLVCSLITPVSNLLDPAASSTEFADSEKATLP